MKSIRYIILLLLVVLSVDATAQKNLAKGNKYFDRNLFEEAIPYYEKELKKGNYRGKIEAREKLADCYRLTGRFFEAEEMYLDLLNKNKRKKKPEYYLNYAQSLKSSAKYEEAAEQFTKYMELAPEDPMGSVFLESCYQAQQWLDQEAQFMVRNFEAVNTPVSDFAPAHYGKGIVFASSREGSKKKFISMSDEINQTRMDLYFQDLERKEGKFPEVEGFDGLNSWMHEGSPTFTADGREVYFSRTVGGSKDKKTNSVLSSLQVFGSRLDKNGKWSEAWPVFDFNSDSHSVGQPSVNGRGTRIYFVSDMEGGQGATDIYYSELEPDGSWGEAVNLGGEVNTFGHELFPYIKGEDTLYFASDTHPGMGQLDIFMSVWDGTKWGEAQNLRPPFNSIANDFGMSMEASGKRGFFSSDRFNGMGAEDIYTFSRELPMQVSLEGQTLRIADLEIYDGISHKIKEEGASDPIVLKAEEGYFQYPLEKEKVYELSTRREGFFYNKMSVMLSQRKGMEEPVLTLVSKNRDFRVGRQLLAGEEVMEGKEMRLITDEEELSRKLTDARGRVEFTSLLTPGIPYHVECIPSGEFLAEEIVETITVEESTGSSSVFISGRVVELSDQSAVEGARVLLLEDGFPENEVSSAADGSFRFEAVSGRTYSVLAAREGSPHREVELPGNLEGSVQGVLLELVSAGALFSGLVTDLNSGEALGEVQLSLEYEGLQKPMEESNAAGNFQFRADPAKAYKVVFSREGYFNESLELLAGGPTEGLSVSLKPLEAEKAMAMDEVSFTGPAQELDDASVPELDRLYTFMESNPEVRIEVGAHGTTEEGNDALTVSQMRAEAVIDYLVYRGLEHDRVWARGFGDSQGKDDGVEFRVIEEGDEGLEGSEIIFSVQIGAYRKTGWSRVLEQYRKAAGEHRFNQFTDHRGLTLFQVGMFYSYTEAETARQDLLTKDIGGAFVVAYQEHERISVTKAREITGESSPQELAASDD